MRVFGSPLRDVFRDEVVTPDWDLVWSSTLELVRELNHVCAPAWATSSSRSLIEPAELAVDIWVNPTLHAGTFELGDRVSVVLQAGVLNVVHTFPSYVAQVALRGDRSSPSDGFLAALATWIDHAASQGEMRLLPTGGDAPPQQVERYVGLMAQLGLAFVLTHELAHVYVANAAEPSLHDEGWRGMTSLERRHHIEYLADRLALDGLLRWLPTWADADAGRAGRLAFTGAWMVLRGFALLEAYDSSLVPTLHPTAQRRIARLRDHARRTHGDITRTVDDLEPDVDMVAGAGLERATSDRTRAADIIRPALKEAERSPASRRRLESAMAEALVLSEAETTGAVLEVFRRAPSAENTEVRQVLYQILTTRLPIARFNNLIQLCAAEHLAWDQPRRRMTLT